MVLLPRAILHHHICQLLTSFLTFIVMIFRLGGDYKRSKKDATFSSGINQTATCVSDPGLPLSNNQTMSCDMWQLPFAVARAQLGSGCMFIVHRASEN